MDRHNKAVAKIAATVRKFYALKEPFRIHHGSTNSTRPTLRSNVVDTSSLSHVLRIDTKKCTALVEPNVPMDRLVRTTLEYGLVPPVVMEFPGITVGGGYAGTSGESSSFKHGFFNRTINYVEMVLANGDIVTASDKEKPDLFHGAAGAVGSLGVATLVELQLLQAKEYVETTYHPVSSISEAISKVRVQTTNSDLDYVDGILYSKTSGAIVTGRLTNTLPPNTAPQTFTNPKDPWFYLHVQDAIKRSPSSQPIKEYIPLSSYLFRYDRGGFWVGRSAFSYFLFPFNRLTRWFLNDFLHTRMLYKALHASGESVSYVVQDLALPYATAQQFIEYTDRAFGIYPLWLCPLRQSPLPTMHPHHASYEPDEKTLKPMLNIGLWGFGPRDRATFINLNRDLERKLRDFGGMKWLYAHTYYTESEFWSMFDKDWYDALRKKYNAASLPSVYDKAKVNVEKEKEKANRSWGIWLLGTWPFGGLWGLWKAIRSQEYLMHRSPLWRKAIKDNDKVDETVD
jgi:Delta24-sterol reductase